MVGVLVPVARGIRVFAATTVPLPIHSLTTDTHGGAGQTAHRSSEMGLVARLRPGRPQTCCLPYSCGKGPHDDATEFDKIDGA